jgi:transposase, IS4
MHTQRGTAQWIISRGAHYALTVKDNQPGLKRELEKLPWKDVPSTSVPDGSHGRRVRRTIKAVEAPARVDFPGAAQDDPPPATWTGPGRPRPGSRHRYGW